MKGNRILVASLALALIAGVAGVAPAVPIGGGEPYDGPCSDDTGVGVYVTDSAGNPVEGNEIKLVIDSSGQTYYATSENTLQTNGFAFFLIPGSEVHCCEDSATLYLDNPPAGHTSTQFTITFSREEGSCPYRGPGDDTVKEWDFGGGTTRSMPDDCADLAQDGWLKVAYPPVFGFCPF